MHHTVCIETHCGNDVQMPVEHRTAEAAERYARDLTSRRICDVRVISDGSPIVIYRDGAALNEV